MPLPCPSPTPPRPLCGLPPWPPPRPPSRQAYLKVGPQVAAQGPQYRQPLASHLVAVKARHWEKATRELAARAAAALVPYHASYFSGPALDELLPACLNDQLEVRGRWRGRGGEVRYRKIAHRSGLWHCLDSSGLG